MKITVVDDGGSPFGKRDAALISAFADVTHLPYRGKGSLPRLAVAVARSDAVLSWFALGYAYTAVKIANILGKRSYIVAGGWDVEWMPEIGYGALNPKRRKMTRRALENCTKVLCVSRWTERSVKRAAPEADTVVVPLAVDTRVFEYADRERERAVCTVASARNETTARVKGLDVFVKVAEKMPDWDFRIAGNTDAAVLKRLCGELPSNLKLLGYLKTEELVSLYGRCAVYAQLSYQESFGIAPAEAAICGCSVIVSDRGALPEIHGEYATVVEYGDVEGVVDAVTGCSLLPRKRKMEKYEPERRALALEEIIG